MKQRKIISPQKLLVKLASFCAYQERCVQDVERKLNDYELSPDERQDLIDYLIKEKYIDESRYSKSVVRGKFNFRHWGRNKLKAYLYSKGIDNAHIQKGLKEIKEPDYLLTCIKLVESKKEKLSPKELSEFDEKQKIIASLSQKGYEFDVINKALSEVY